MVDLNAPSLILDSKNEVTIEWNPSDIFPNYLPENLTSESSTRVSVDLYVHQYSQNEELPDWMSEKPIVQGQSLDAGEASVKIPKLDIECRMPRHDSIRSIEASFCAVIIKVYVSIPIEGEKIVRHAFALNEVGGWSGVNFMETESSHNDVCSQWEVAEKDSKVSGETLLETVLPCPPTELLARSDFDYEREEMTSVYRTASYGRRYMDLFHSGITVCYRQTV